MSAHAADIGLDARKHLEDVAQDAARQLASAKRRLVQYTVEPLTVTLVTIARRWRRHRPPEDLRPLQSARCVFAAAQQRHELIALDLAQLHPVRYIHHMPQNNQGA